MYRITRHDMRSHHGRLGSESSGRLSGSGAGAQKNMAVTVAIGNAVAGGLGYLHGRNGGMLTRFGVPLDGALALLGLGFAFWKPSNKFARYSFDAGLGASIYFTGSVGAGYGSQRRKDAGEMVGTAGGQLSADQAKTANVSPRAVVGGFAQPAGAMNYGRQQAQVAGWHPSHFR